MNTYIAIDVGGTQIRVALFAEGNMKPLAVKKTATRGKNETSLQRLIGAIHEVWPEDGSVRSIGIAVPGPSDPKKGILYVAVNIPGWVNLPLVQILEDEFHVPVALGNDANAATLGEWKFGAGRGHDHVLYMTISTGIGGGVVSDGHLLVGAHGLATELGHMTVLYDGPVCSCGKLGHLEAIASGPGITRYVVEKLKAGAPSTLQLEPPPTTKDISIAAAGGDALAIEAFQYAGKFLGVALADHLHAFNPSIIILGGGVIQAGDVLLNPLRESLHEHVMAPQYVQDLVIAKAQFGDDAGLMGALALAQSL